MSKMMAKKKGKKGSPPSSKLMNLGEFEAAHGNTQKLRNVDYNPPVLESIEVLPMNAQSLPVTSNLDLSNRTAGVTDRAPLVKEKLPDKKKAVSLPARGLKVGTYDNTPGGKSVDLPEPVKRKEIKAPIDGCFQVKQAMDLKTSLGSENFNQLSFHGVTQMTDLILLTLMVHNSDGKLELSGTDLCKTKCSKVKQLDLSGCFNLTDAGIEVIPDVFPNLEEIKLSGCGRITETGLHPLMNKCSQLKKVNIQGTDVSILPYKAAKVEINTYGYPCISPEKEILLKQGTKLIEASAYPKPPGEDLVKVCVMPYPGVQHSFVKYVKNEKDKSLDPLETLKQFKLGDRFQANFVQCHESMSDLFITKRAVYVFTVNGKGDTKKTAAWMFALISYIIVKVQKAVFVIAGMNDGADKSSGSLEQIKNEVLAAAKSKATSLRKTLEMQMADIFKGSSKNVQGGKFSSIQDQDIAMTNFILSKSLETLSVQAVDVNLTKSFSGSDCAKAIVSGMEKICTMYPEYQEMASPIYKFTLLDSVDKMLKDGVLSTESNKDSTQKMMQLMSLMGRTVSFSFIDDVSAVCLIDWLAKVCKTAFTPPSASVCMGRVNGLGDSVPMWDFTELKTELQKLVNQEQASNGLSVLMKLGLSVYPSVFISFKDLPSQPVAPLDQFFPEIPAIDKRKELFYTVGYKASLSSPVPGFVMRKLLALSIKLRRWSLAWQSGFIIQEGLVETLVEMREEKGGGSSLSLYCHSVKQHQGQEAVKKLESAVWNTVLQYKTMLDYVLRDNNIPHEMSLVMGKELSKDSGISGLIAKHTYRQEEDSPGSPRLCSNCGVQPQVDAVSWILASHLCKDNLTEDNCVADESIQRSGNLLRFPKKGMITIRSFLTADHLPTCRVHLLQGSVDKLKVGLGFGFISDKNIFLGRLYIDFGKKLIVKEKTRELKYETEFTTPITSVPKVGDDIYIKLREKDMYNIEVRFYMNTEVIATVDSTNHRFLPFIEKFEESGDTPEEVLVYPLYTQSTKNTLPTALEEGMKLEAVDIKNPNLVCAATIATINTEGKLLIHFDGWGNNYDYWDVPTSKNFHPIGFMYKNAHKYPRLNSTLQKPRGYVSASGGKDFSWPQYFKETSSIPVPYDLFTAEQIEDTTREEEDKVLEILALDSSVGMTCSSSRNRAKVFEFSVIKKCRTPDKLFDFFNQHSKFFTIMPREMNTTKLQYPSLLNTMDFSKQNVHILCPGTKMELLHMLDQPGVPLSKFESLTDGQNAAFLQNCMSGLLIQEEILPVNCSAVIPGIENTEEREKFELWLQRLMFMYMCIFELHASNVSKVAMTREAMEIFNTALKDPHVGQLFVEGDRYVRCKGHSGSSMANNNLREIPMEEFSNVYSFMTRLDFQNNEILTLPAEFFKMFTALEYLNLSRNGISELAVGIGSLKDLTELDISNNRIEKLPTDFEQLGPSLVVLNISNNNLNGLPPCIFKLVKLEELQAENIGVIADLSPIRNLMELKCLNLGLNHIAKIPDELGDLQLEYLDLSGVPWIPQNTYQSYFAFMKQLNINNVTKTISGAEQKKMFKTADVDESSTLTPDEVQTLSNDILFPKYPRFGTGQLSFEKTGGFPPVLFSLTKLKKLVLRYHGITMVPDEVKVFTSLNEIDLSYNPKMISISAELGGLPLKQIHASECTALNTPPKEIVARGFLAIMGYLKRLRLGAVPCKRTKLMLVGLGGAGKTSLVQSLMSQRYRAYMDHDEPITDGIDIKTWRVPISGQSQGEDSLMFSVWDFAGQTVYYNTHQFFLSNRAVYLLLWNVRQGYEHAGLDFWLSSIACHAPKAPVLVVGTHTDKVEKFRLPEETLKSRYPQIVGFHYVSSYTGKGVDDLRQTIISNTLQQKYMGEKIPEAWLTLEKKLIAYRDEKSTDILPFKTLEAVSATCGIFDKGELVQAVQFLHDLGAVQFFDTDFLRSMIVIYPQWIVDVMACLVTVHQGAVKEGKMLLKDISKIWEAYPSDLHPWLLRLTEEFDLTCPLPDEEASIVPCLLPDAEPKYEWPHADPEKNIRESVTLYKFQYLPAGLFNRAQVRLHQYSKGALLWKTGSFMKKNNHIALMIQTDDQEVIVRAQGFRPENFLFIVHEMIETLIRESYSGVQYDFYIPCMDCQSRNVKDPSMMSYQKVKRAMELNVPFLQCEKFFHMLSLQELKDAMPSDKMDEMDNHLRNSVRELIDLTHEKTVSVFFVYSMKDVPQLENAEKLVHPGDIMEDLRSHDEFKVSYTDKPESSDMEALTLSIKGNDVIIFGLSDNFAANEECKKLLLYTKEVLHRPILLLLLGNTKHWQKGDLNMPLGDEVFVDMTKKERYTHKIKELYDAIKKKDDSKKKIKEDVPDCFISYCWTNSHEAIDKGSRAKEGSLGWTGGDPRAVKKFLAEKGIKCWIDVERVGGVGLYTSIADGLREAKVMIAFVSDEYQESKNCVMEFRQSLITLRVPTIIAVVGTGYKWEEKEVGLMSVGQKCPKVNLQFENQGGYLQLLKMVQETITNNSKGKDESQDVDKQRNIAFQEVLELTQRKFLRHLTNSYISNDLEPYPCLFLVDFISDKEREDWEAARIEEDNKARKMEEQTTEGESSKGGGNEEKQERVVVRPPLKSKYCFRLLCEHTEGWHVMPTYVPFPEMDREEEQQLVENSAPYLSRVYTIVKYSNMQLECLTTPEGEILQQKLEEIGVKSGGDFKNEYLSLRTTVMQEDRARSMAGLTRSQMNGKMVWLCDAHKKAGRSKTEERYADKFHTDDPIPTADLPESFAPIEPEVKEEATPRETTKQKKLFRRNISDQRPGLKRQTSQACNVM